MTTGKSRPRESFYGAPNPTLGDITCKEAAVSAPDTPLACIDLGGDAGRLFLHDPDLARQLLEAGLTALRILDPDAAVIIRASNQALYALEEILPATRPPEHAPELTECAKCHLIGTPADMDPVTWSAPGTGESGTHWYCKDMTACSNRAVPGLAEHLKQAGAL